MLELMIIELGNTKWFINPKQPTYFFTLKNNLCRSIKAITDKKRE